jgi:hypothetical protein
LTIKNFSFQNIYLPDRKMFKISFVAFPILARSTALIGGSNNAAAYTATAAIQTAKSNAVSDLSFLFCFE